MVETSKRTTCALATVVTAFIIVIIILCLVPDPCRRNDRRPHCKRPRFSASEGDHRDHQTTASTTDVPPTTATKTTPSSLKPSEPSSTSQSPPTSASSTSQKPSTSQYPVTSASPSSDSSVSSTGSTEESPLRLEDSNDTTISTDITESSFFSDEDNTSTQDSYTSNTTDVFDTSDNATITTELTDMTTEFGNSNETDFNSYDYGNTTTDIMSTTFDLNEMLNETGTSTSETSQTMFTTEISNSETTQSTFATGMSTTETIDSTLATDISTTETVEVEDRTEMSTETTVDVDLSSSTFRPPEAIGEICDTKVCREISRRMLDMMDPRDINPCDDFYQYSCGGVLDDPFLKPEDPEVFANKIIKDALTYDEKDDEDLKDLFTMYDSCLSYNKVDRDERLVRVRSVFEELGYEFSPTDGSHVPEDSDFRKVLAKMMKRNFAPFFDIKVDIKRDARDEMSLSMIPPSLTSPFTNDRAQDFCFNEYKADVEEAKYRGETFDFDSHYEDYVNCMKNGRGLDERRQHIENSVKVLDLSDFIENSTITNMTIDVLGKLANVMPSAGQIRNALATKDYEEVTVEEIDKGHVFGELPFNMLDFLKDLMETKHVEAETTTVQVYFKDAFTEVFRLISVALESETSQMQNIMLLLWTEHIYNDLINPVGIPIERSDYCLKAVTELMDDHVSFLYLKKLPDTTAMENQMKRMIDVTLGLMTSQVKKSSLEFRESYEKKLEEMTGDIATLNGVQRVLRKNKEKFQVDLDANNFPGNYVNLMKNYRKILYNHYLDVNTDRILWNVLQFPYRHTGVTSYNLNKFLIPHGAMSPPYYYEGAPTFINYAGIGHMIAHEILHVFDPTGIQYSEADAHLTLTKDHDCLTQQLTHVFSTNDSTEIIFKLPEKLHLNELLSNVPAPSLAWNAYLKDSEYKPPPPITTTEEPILGSMSVRRRRSAKGRRAKSARYSVGTVHTTLSDDVLVHLEDKTIQQIFFIKTAQNHCSSTSKLDDLKARENEHLPHKLRVNLAMGNNKMFMKAFNCDKEINPKMVPHPGVCFYNPTGFD